MGGKVAPVVAAARGEAGQAPGGGAVPFGGTTASSEGSTQTGGGW